MSHSKFRKRGKSLYIDSWNPGAKKYIVACIQCGAKGYKPSISETDFDNSIERKAVKAELMSGLEPLSLDEGGLCEHCSDVINKTEL